ncbi:MAG: hypothetical protein IJQ34_02870 [Kiritimatiellae bacterium]|nr:hypothetical protein [Kiritimatiellia bacterium]
MMKAYSRFAIFSASMLGCFRCFSDGFLRIQSLEFDQNYGVILNVEADKDYSYTVLTSQTLEGLNGDETASVTNTSEAIPVINEEYTAKRLFLEKEEGNLRFFRVVGSIEDYTTYSGTITDDITIPANTTIKLDGVTLSSRRVICLGNATIILSGVNTITSTDYVAAVRPGAVGTTLTIKGTGSLTATAGIYAAGIGGDYQTNCGNIVIEGGTISANGGLRCSGIGSGLSASCGDITITGGDITAIRAEGLGKTKYDIGPAATNSSCGTITISSSATVTGTVYEP